MRKGAGLQLCVVSEHGLSSNPSNPVQNQDMCSVFFLGDDNEKY